jgi:large subunit ribosomal protein L19
VIDQEILKKIKAGAKVRVHERVKEGDKERISIFEGLILSRRHGSEPGASFTVRGKLGEFGLEKTYPIHSSLISKIEIVSSPRKVKRSKLYFLRELSSRKVREKTGAA